MATEIIEQNQLFRNVQKAKWAVEYNPFHKIFFSIAFSLHVLVAQKHIQILLRHHHCRW